MRFITIIAPVLALALSAAVVAAQDRALLIGIGSGYEGPNALVGPEKDVEIAGDLARKLGYAEGEVKTLLNRQATRDGILSGFKWVQAGVKDGGKAFIYFSGHGYQVEDTNGDEEDGCDEVLVGADMKFVIDDEIGSTLEGMGNADVLMMIDSCFSGTIHKGLYGGDLKKTKTKTLKNYKGKTPQCGTAINRSKGYVKKSIGAEADLPASARGKLVVLSATAQNEVAYPSFDNNPSLGSAFTQAIVDTIGEKGTKISFRELINDSREKVKRESETRGLIKHTPQIETSADVLDMAVDMGGAAHSNTAPRIETSTSEKEVFSWLEKNSKFAVSVKADKTNIRMAEKISFSVYSSRDGYLNILELDPENNVTVIFPNKHKAGNNRITADNPIRVPEDIGGFKFVGQGVPGPSRILALVTPEPVNLYESKGDTKSNFRSFGRGNVPSLKKNIISSITKGGRTAYITKSRSRSIGAVADDSTANTEGADFGSGAITVTVKP